jgi:hypothetical protein
MCNTVQYSIVYHSIAKHSTVQYSTVYHMLFNQKILKYITCIGCTHTLEWMGSRGNLRQRFGGNGCDTV